MGFGLRNFTAAALRLNNSAGTQSQYWNAAEWEEAISLALAGGTASCTSLNQ